MPITRDFGDRILRPQLLERRPKLETAIAAHGQAAHLVEWLEKVDAALERMNDESYGLYQACHLAIERWRLLSNPLAEY